MKTIQLTQGQVALVDDEDYEYLNQFKWYALFYPHTNTFYAIRNSPKINSKRTTISMHRVIMGVTDPKIKVDHIHHNTLNNCRSNLRLATYSQNNANRKSRENSSSQYLGVYWHKSVNKWHARISKDNKNKHIGLFDKEYDAALAYDDAAIKIHGEFANLNLKKITGSLNNGKTN